MKKIILKTFLDKRMLDFCTPIIFGSSKLITAYKKSMIIDLPFKEVKEVGNAVLGCQSLE